MLDVYCCGDVSIGVSVRNNTGEEVLFEGNIKTEPPERT